MSPFCPGHNQKKTKTPQLPLKAEAEGFIWWSSLQVVSHISLTEHVEPITHTAGASFAAMEQVNDGIYPLTNEFLARADKLALTFPQPQLFSGGWTGRSELWSHNPIENLLDKKQTINWTRLYKEQNFCNWGSK